MQNRGTLLNIHKKNNDVSAVAPALKTREQELKKEIDYLNCQGMYNLY